LGYTVEMEAKEKLILVNQSKQKISHDALPHPRANIIREVSRSVEERTSMTVPLPGSRKLCISVAENQHGGKDATIIIKNPDNPSENLDMADLVKNLDGRATHFYPVSKFGASVKLNIVNINMERLRDPRCIFTLLHELGHVVDFNNRIKNGKNVDAFDLLFSADYYDEKFWRERLQAERTAWAEAIKLARKLKKDHTVDLFKLFKDADEFMGWMRVNALRSYENHLENIGIKAYSKEAAVRKFCGEEAELVRKEWGALSEEDRLEFNRISSLI